MTLYADHAVSQEDVTATIFLEQTLEHFDNIGAMIGLGEDALISLPLERDAVGFEPGYDRGRGEAVKGGF
jgi:hypothetical protein